MIDAPSTEQMFETAAAARAELRAMAMASFSTEPVTPGDLSAAASAAALHVVEQGGDEVLLRKALVRTSYSEARAMMRARRQTQR